MPFNAIFSRIIEMWIPIPFSNTDSVKPWNALTPWIETGPECVDTYQSRRETSHAEVDPHHPWLETWTLEIAAYLVEADSLQE